jgi:hypothetical protein
MGLNTLVLLKLACLVYFVLQHNLSRLAMKAFHYLRLGKDMPRGKTNTVGLHAILNNNDLQHQLTSKSGSESAGGLYWTCIASLLSQTKSPATKYLPRHLCWLQVLGLYIPIIFSVMLIVAPCCFHYNLRK